MTLSAGHEGGMARLLQHCIVLLNCRHAERYRCYIYVGQPAVPQRLELHELLPRGELQCTNVLFGACCRHEPLRLLVADTCISTYLSLCQIQTGLLCHPQLANISAAACNQPFTANTTGSGVPIGTGGSHLAVSPGDSDCCAPLA